MNRDRSEDPELSLAQGLDELRTQVTLQEAFDQATARPPQQQVDDSELELPSPNEMGNREDAPPRERARDLGTQPSTNQSRAVPQRRVRGVYSKAIDSNTCTGVYVHCPTVVLMFMYNVPVIHLIVWI